MFVHRHLNRIIGHFRQLDKIQQPDGNLAFLIRRAGTALQLFRDLFSSKLMLHNDFWIQNIIGSLAIYVEP